MYVDEQKVYESHPGQTYEEIRDEVEKVLKAALTCSKARNVTTGSGSAQNPGYWCMYYEGPAASARAEKSSRAFLSSRYMNSGCHWTAQRKCLEGA